MGKEEIDNFFCLIGDIWIFLQKCLLSSPMFQTTFVQIGEFDWLSVRPKGLIFVKVFKNLLRNNKGDEAETWHTCSGQASTKVVFCSPVG